MAQSIGILGSGVVGIALANGFVKYTNDEATLGSFTETAEFGEMVILVV